MAAQSRKTQIWLDVDTGHDDAFAILLAARSPEIQLLGISTVYGNAPLVNTTYNTRAILKAIGREDVPVYAGVAKPFFRKTKHSPEIHGESGLDGTTCLPTPSVPVRDDTTAVDAAYRALIATQKGTAWLVPTGPLTNTALLFATHPDLVDHIAGVSIMGGAVGGGFTDAPLGVVKGEGERFGNQTPFAEFNIYIDPESARSILSNPAIAQKTTLITLDLTHQFLATAEVRQALLYGFSVPADETREPSLVRKLFVEILMFFSKTYAEVFGIVKGPPVHDPLAVAAAYMPLFFFDGNRERYEVDVVTDGEHASSTSHPDRMSQCGRTILRASAEGCPGVRVPRSLDAVRVWQALEECLAAVERDSP